MQSQALFSLDEEFIPHSDRVEPLVWICGLAILSQPSVEGQLRIVPFHRGLNIVQAEERGENEKEVVAHSVGKTLLMRLIRYSAGEPTYASEESQADLMMALPSAAIVAHWRVNSEDWIAFRPLHDHDPAASYCVHASDWKSAFSGELERVSFKSFCNSIETAVAKDLPSFEHTKGRRPTWLDILGWLARDCECGYRQANEWRHQDTNLGKPTDLTDNSLMLQWLCGLISQSEAELRKNHRQLLSERSKTKSVLERQTRNLELLEENLRRSMEFPKPPDMGESHPEPGDPFSTTSEPEESLSQHAQAMIIQLGKILDEMESKSPIPGLEQKELELEERLEQANQDEGVALGEVMSAKRYHASLKASSDSPALLRKCPATPCELVELLKQRSETGKDEAKEDNLQSVEAEIAEHEANQKAARKERTSIKEDVEETRRQLAIAQSKLVNARIDINESIGRWKIHLKDAEAVDQIKAEATDHSVRLADLTKAVEDSSSKLDAARDSMDVKQRTANISNFYTQILRRVFGDAAHGSIQVDGNGLQPKAAKKLAPGGRALSAMATVISFDLACVMASIAGVGSHPRFLIHDSPREGEMEMPLFRKLFDVACFRESAFSGAEPSFQYIVTTTKAPPEFCEQGEKHTCITLHARFDEGRLLKRAF